jgi:hypothetical protein
MLTAAGLLSIATLVTPAAATAQISPERALLNSTPVVSYTGITVVAGPPGTVGGARALLGQPAGPSSELNVAINSLGEAGPINGEQALQNKLTPAAKRRLTLAL